ncbi:MAG: glycosyltransferase family 39 protein, partial [Chloroflexota bacterium]
MFFASRLIALDALPLHNDEGLHLTRAVEVWNGHPFWDISDGKIINHWFIALFFPQETPVFAARIATVLVVMLGVAAAYGLARHLAGHCAGLLAMGIWTASPYLFFYERTAQSDPQAAALVTVAVWGVLLFAERGTYRWAIYTGCALAWAALMKLNAGPHALAVAGVVLTFGVLPWRRRLLGLGVMALTGVAALAVPTVYAVYRGDGLFSVALAWLGG